MALAKTVAGALRRGPSGLSLRFSLPVMYSALTQTLPAAWRICGSTIRGARSGASTASSGSASARPRREVQIGAALAAAKVMRSLGVRSISSGGNASSPVSTASRASVRGA